jgi:hypothetical protein
MTEVSPVNPLTMFGQLSTSFFGEASHAGSPMEIRPGDGSSIWFVCGLSTERVSSGSTKTTATTSLGTYYNRYLREMPSPMILVWFLALLAQRC